MLFVELRFFLFFAIVLSVYWSLKSNNLRKWFILCASYYFYGSWNWRFAVMLFVLSSLDWFFALRLSQTEVQKVRKAYVTASLAMNLSVLAFFKYFHFFVGSAIAMARGFHLQLDEPTIRIILPVGVSFFTFQSLSYTIDVYRREIPPVHSLCDYLFCDFSGYSDMAIAVAGLLGFKFVLNFDAPYLANSIQDFWRRWHISLSTWIRDYIYFSLGGSRMKYRIWFTATCSSPCWPAACGMAPRGPSSSGVGHTVARRSFIRNSANIFRPHPPRSHGGDLQAGSSP